MATCGSRFAATQQPALLLVLAVCMLATACAPGAHAQLLPPIGALPIANLTIVNSLSASLVAQLAGSEQSVTVAPGEEGVLQVGVPAVVENINLPIVFTYQDTEYSASGNTISKLVVLTNTVSVNVSTPCVNGQSPGLQANTTADSLVLGPIQLNSECALPTSA
ncbi:hypothetical protein M758_10G161400 [Ceratodon purpureus]|nr:hypothetical protein M758_10G161400 [Ceratodon purpureus]